MANESGLGLDFLTQIVNVQWTSGLAVEFTDRPDYLTMNHALSMNKVAISFWFRVPTEAATAAQAKSPFDFWDYRVFLGVIPLITWGAQQTTPVSDIVYVDTGAIDVSSVPILVAKIAGTHTAPLQPSCIGVRVGSKQFPEPPVLDIHIQTNIHGSGQGLKSISTGFTGEMIGINQVPGPHEGKPIYHNIVYTDEDVSSTVTEEPEYFGNSDSNVSNSGAGHPELTLDQWHHLLISWELQSHSNKEGASKMWCAIDDKNKNGVDLPAMCNIFVGMGPNDHLSGTCFSYQENDRAFVSVSFASNNVPSDPFHTPAPPTVKRASDPVGGSVSIAPIDKVELAELQVFTGVTLDTSNQINRRAFIDFERDENGNPIRDENGKTHLKPVDPKKAEELLGKRPDILLHGSTKWQDGKNTGSIGIDADGEEIPIGQFHPTGEIKKYLPDPEIIES